MAAANTLAEETKVFQDLRANLNKILPIITMIPLIPQDIRTKASDVLTKLNAIPTIEDMMNAK